SLSGTKCCNLTEPGNRSPMRHDRSSRYTVLLISDPYTARASHNGLLVHTYSQSRQQSKALSAVRTQSDTDLRTTNKIVVEICQKEIAEAIEGYRRIAAGRRERVPWLTVGNDTISGINIGPCGTTIQAERSE